MTTLRKTLTSLFAAGATIFTIGACDTDRHSPERVQAQADVDRAKIDAKEMKAQAEDNAKIAKDRIDGRLESTKDVANASVAAAEAKRDAVNAEERQPVRGADHDFLGPDEEKWNGWWSAYARNPKAVWGGDDWIVERQGATGFRGYRKVGAALDTNDKVNDQALSAAVKARLVAGAALAAQPIDVSSRGGQVTLSGNVSNLDEVGEAMRVALGTKGVRQVYSNLRIR